MLTNYSWWVGKPVVMNIVCGTSEVPLCCTLLGEFKGHVRVRIRDKWDVDIFKDMIGSIEADTGSAQEQIANFFEA